MKFVEGIQKDREGIGGFDEKARLRGEAGEGYSIWAMPTELNHSTEGRVVKPSNFA